MFKKTRQSVSQLNAHLQNTYRPKNIRQQAFDDYYKTKQALKDPAALKQAKVTSKHQRHSLLKLFCIVILAFLICVLLSLSLSLR